MVKKCSTCKEELSISSFYEGYARCKKCHYAATQRWAKANILKRRASIKAYQDRNPGVSKEIRRKAKQAWQERNPGKRKAGTAISNALRDGKIQKAPCAACKKNPIPHTKVHAHHSDYSKPLEVLWLCPTHHRAWHRVFQVESA
jgi:hypothetical protein